MTINCPGRRTLASVARLIFPTEELRSGLAEQTAAISAEFLLGGFSTPHCPHRSASGAPHSPQNALGRRVVRSPVRAQHGSLSR
jgi:hypothetical protein